MRYLAMIFTDKPDSVSSEQDRQTLFNEYVRFNRDAKEAGVFLGGEALRSGETATVVKMMESGARVSDGPFDDVTEAITGFYMLECENLDQAIEWAARIPAARNGAIEVRPVLESDD